MADSDKDLADWVQACPSTPLSAAAEEARFTGPSTSLNAAAGIQQVDELLTTQQQVGAGSMVPWLMYGGCRQYLRYHG